ncbi:MAG: DUF885 domain-containing protein [Gammaproteobacteria bacterium]|nr:MAG: DUF885 domain-containing protein [Gammaproteobacteria bacterium]
MKIVVAVMLLLLLSSCSSQSENDRLEQIFSAEWQQRLSVNPIFRSSFETDYHATSLADISLEALTKQAAFDRSILEQLDGIDYQKLDDLAQINYRIFREQVEDSLASFDFGSYQIPFNSDSSFFSSFARISFQVPFNNQQDYQNYLKILGSWPKYVEQQIAHMKVGLKRGMTQPKELLDNTVSSVTAFITDDPQKSTFFKPFQRFPKTFTEQQTKQLIEAAKTTINESITPSYQKLAHFIENEYIPNARTSLGATDLPNGSEYYQQRVNHFTTLDLGVDEIHQLGLNEVSRIRAEMQEVIDNLEFEGSFKDFIHFLRTDPQFYAKSAEDLLKQAAWIAKRMDAKLPSLFNHLPRLPYGVQAVPASIAPTYTTGRYVSAPTGSTEPGYYWVNTHALDKRPLYVLESLTLHEAVPGHHLQISLSNELDNLPLFRQYSYISAFGEGWGLYSEWLGIEAGFYQDPYSNFGRLTYEMWRAVRLVVDTGIHAKNWTRQQARDYLSSNTALSLHNVYTEIDRYITWPGQALSYKMGEIKIKQLRQKAEQVLGENFNVRDFHDAVLSQGSVPMDVLADQIQDYIDNAAR